MAAIEALNSASAAPSNLDLAGAEIELVPANGPQHDVLGLVTQSGVLLTLMEGEIHGFWATLPRRASTA